MRVVRSVMNTKIRSYAELSRIDGFEGRFKYLRLHASIGVPTFGFDRYLNQMFYTSTLWRQVRNHVIARDVGCDLGVRGFEIHDRVVIHHVNPIAVEDIVDGSPDIIDPEFLITVSHKTHNAIHYGDESLLPKALVTRRPGDTKLW